MASAAYLALIEETSARWVCLANITAREALVGWTSAGSGAYSLTWLSQTHPAAIRADLGLYRELTGVTENGVALTVRGDVVSVQANPGSYYYDAATGVLTVETSGSVNPDTLALMQAVFVVRVATEPMNFSDRPPYDAQIDGRTLPSFRMDRPELLRGVNSFPSGDLPLQNADGFWDYPAAAWIWTNATVEFFTGSPSMVYTDFERQMKMQVARKPTAGDAEAKIQLRARTNATDRAFPQNDIEDFYFGAAVTAGGGDPALPLPVWWGYVYDAPLVFVMDNGSRNKFISGDPTLLSAVTYGQVFAVERATGTRTALAVTTDYDILGGPDWGIDVDPAYPPETYDIIAEVGRTGRTCGIIARQILESCGVPSSEVDSAAFTQCDIDNPATLTLWVGQRPGEDRLSSLKTGRELINLIERSTFMEVYQKADGVWTARVKNPYFVWSALKRRTDSELSRCEPVDQVTSHPVANISVRYFRKVYFDKWSSTYASSSEAVHRLDADETETVETCLVTETDAALLKARLLMCSQQEPLELEIEDGAELMTYNPSDKLRVQRARGASKAGTFDEPMEFTSITKHLASMTVTGVIGNQMGIGGVAGRVVAPDGTAAFGSASADEKMQYAFVHDDNSLVGGSTKRQAVLW